MVDCVLGVSELSVRYGRTTAVSSASFEVASGERVAVIGPNGAGKSSLLGAIATVIPYDGTITLAGSTGTTEDIETRPFVGFVPAEVQAPSGLNVLDTLHYYGWLRRMPKAVVSHRAGDLLDQVGMQNMARKRAAALSTGYSKRLGLAIALMDRPSVLVLDEFTNGVDESNREPLLNLASQTSVLVLASHSHADVHRLATRALIMRGGVIERSEPLDDDTGRRHEQIAALFRSI